MWNEINQEKDCRDNNEKKNPFGKLPGFQVRFYLNYFCREIVGDFRVSHISASVGGGIKVVVWLNEKERGRGTGRLR